VTRRLRVAGVDEAGRGPLAGPVAVAAVILHPARPIDGLNDSKQLPEARREELAPLIRARALAWHVEFIDVADIDRLNILHATMLGMTRAVLALQPLVERVLVDGNRLPPGMPCPARALVGGDAREPAIMAASILAKVARDRLMCELAREHPGYGFAEHKGYPTPEHIEALRRLGPCVQHRRSFAPVRSLLQTELAGI
jgi:ribonuclease HII